MAMNKLKYIVVVLLPLFFGLNVYAQSEWEEMKKTISISSLDGLSINNSTYSSQMWNVKAATKEEKKNNIIACQTGKLNIYGFYNDAKTTQVTKKLVIDIHDDHGNPSSYRYRVYNDKGREEWVEGAIYWGLSVNFKGTDGNSYYVSAWYCNVGWKNGMLTYQDSKTDIHAYGYVPGRGKFDEQWQRHSYSSDAMPDGVSITYQTNGTCIIQFGNSYPNKTFTINNVSSITDIKFMIGSGARITVSNYRIMKESVYAKVKTHIQNGDSRVKNEDYLGAVEAYTKVIDGGYKNYDIYYKRASAYYCAEFFNNAIDDYTSALSYKTTEDAYLYRGLAKLQKNDISCIDDLKRGGTKGQALIRELDIDNSNPGIGAQAGPQYSASGTGFIIDPKGFIATNYHVIEGAKGIDVYITTNGKTIAYAATPIVVDKANDLAIIKINDSKFKTTSAIPYSFGAGTKDVGTSVFAMGYPELSYLGEEIKVTDGIISSKTGYQGDITTYQISAPIQHGNSGGPLFDKNGYLVGITNAGVISLQNVGYAIKVSYLNNLIDACPESISLPQSNQLTGLSLPDKIKRLSPFVVIIKVYERGSSPAGTGQSSSSSGSSSRQTAGSRTINVTNNMLETDYHKFQVISVVLEPTTTKVNVRVYPKSTRTAIWNEKGDYIEDAETGKKYYITESTIGIYENNTATYQPGMKVLSDMSAFDFTKQFPPLTTSVKIINIPSNHLYNLRIR